jgi:single-strand DNA-binding protein
MGNFNKVILMGNLTRDIELKSTTSGMHVANIGLAVNRRWVGQDGERKEETTFVDCEAWGKTAENMAKFFSKGRPVFIEGRLKLDQWEDKEGKKQSKLRVVVEGFEFVDSKAGGGGGSGGGEGGYSKPQVVTRSIAPRPAPAADGPEHSDDIPF